MTITPTGWNRLDIEINDAPAFVYPRAPFRFVLSRKRPSGVDWATKLELYLPGTTRGTGWLWVPGYNGGDHVPLSGVTWTAASSTQ